MHHITGNAAHHMVHVMRLKPGDPLVLFDNLTGEWLATVAAIAKNSMTVTIERSLRPVETLPEVWLCFAPIKKGRLDWMIEKATELGVARFVPVITDRTIANRVRLDRLRTIVIGAAQQCGACALPSIAEPVRLHRFLADQSDMIEKRTLFFADEVTAANASENMRKNMHVATDVAAMEVNAKNSPKARSEACNARSEVHNDCNDALSVMQKHGGPAAILIGPEGGFTPRERALIRSQIFCAPFSLGERILRAETAGLVALALWHSLAHTAAGA